MGSVVKSIGGFLGAGGTSTNGLEGNSQVSADEQFRQAQLLKAQDANQRAFGDQLYNQASGKAPSIADMQMKAAQERSIAQQLAMAKSNRSANAGLQSRNLQNSAAEQAGQVAQASGIARMQEQQDNQKQYSGYMNGLQGNFNGLTNANTAAQDTSYKHKYQNDKDQMTTGMGFLSSVAGGLPMVSSMFSGGGGGLNTTATGITNGGGSAASSGMLQNAAMSGMMLAAHGGKVPGQAPVKGDSLSNDIIDAKLSPGEIVVPRSVVAKGDKAVSAFVKALAEKEKESPEGYGAVLAAKSKMKKA